MTTIDKKWEQFVFVLFVLAVAAVTSLLLEFIVGRFIKAAARKLNADHRHYNFFKHIINFVPFFVAIVVIFRSIPTLRTYGTGLLTGAGVLAAIVGFASQSAFSSIVSGFFLVIFKPFRVGDRVKIGQLYSGDVEDITLRHTVIKDFENKRIFVPNSVMGNEIITNSTAVDEKICLFIEVAVAMKTDLDKAMAIMQEEALKHPLCIDHRSAADRERGNHQVEVYVLTFLAGGILLRAHVWANDSTDAYYLRSDLNKSLKEHFEKESIMLSALQYQIKSL